MVLVTLLEALVMLSGLYEHFVALNHMYILINFKCAPLALIFTFNLGFACL